MKEDKNKDDDYIIAYRRNIAIGEMWLEKYPLPNHDNINQVVFDFDPNSKYQYWGFTPASNIYPQDKYVFIRVGDGAKAILTKYSHIKLNI